ncbi:acyltransferase family protein [Leifsonia sp. McL0607]|uniref:acyltransferase family protein n=1 Tax=Leifsonia sp. McL0607 TaxID=3415672 RepID=UPI003CF1A392
MTTPQPKSVVRPEIQLLRAIAVMAVVCNHFWPGGVTGGYVGVDVFFVVSGFLITSHLLRELQGTGRIRLARFWGRRIRRLLPAAFLVLIVCFVLTMTFVPVSGRTEGLRQIVASALYVQNWVLVADSVDYFRAGASATTVQHFWSLSVEEQFYILWPILLLLGWWWSRASLKKVLVAMTVIGLASLALSIWQSFGPTPSVAYFSTATRVWEFCAGGLLAVIPGLRQGMLAERYVKVRIVSGLLGVVLIAFAVFRFDMFTPFPGYAALLPVVGAILVLIGGSPRTFWSVGGAARVRPVRYIGDISYSLYLWHWPLILIAPVVMLPFGERVDNTVKLIVLLISLALAAATKYLVEDRFRASRGNPRLLRTFLLPVIGAATAIVMAVGANVFVIAPAAEASQKLVSQLRDSGCWGAQAIANDCAEPFGPAPTIDGSFAYADRIRVCDPAVTHAPPSGSSASCDYGTGRDVIAVVGDSHSQIMVTAVAAWAVPRGFTVRLFADGSCPLFGVAALKFPNQVSADTARTSATWQRCARSSEKTMDELEHDDAVRVVIPTNATASYVVRGDPEGGAVTVGSVSAAMDAMERRGKDVVVIRDMPGIARGYSAPECLSLNPLDPVACSVPRSEVFPELDPFVSVARERGLPVIDVTDYICDQGRCYAAVGGTVAYWDRGHLTASMIESLTPIIGSRLDTAIRIQASRSP